MKQKGKLPGVLLAAIQFFTNVLHPVPSLEHNFPFAPLSHIHVLPSVSNKDIIILAWAAWYANVCDWPIAVIRGMVDESLGINE